MPAHIQSQISPFRQNMNKRLQRVKSSLVTIFARFILGFPFSLKHISGFTAAMTLQVLLQP